MRNVFASGEKDRCPPARSAAFWDMVCHTMRRLPYYVHPVLGKYKQREFSRFIDQQLAGSFDRALKTDSFEEAFGEDGLADRLAVRSREVIVMDISPGIVAQARSKFPDKVRRVAADIARMPFKTGTVNLIVSTSTYGYLPDIQQGLQEARRTLKSGGVMVVAINNRQNLLFQPLTQFFVSKNVPFPASRSYSCDEFKMVLERAGFRVECHRPVVHIFPLLKSLVYFLDSTGNRKVLQKIIAWLDVYGERLTGWHYRTAWFVVFKAVKD